MDGANQGRLGRGVWIDCGVVPSSQPKCICLRELYTVSPNQAAGNYLSMRASKKHLMAHVSALVRPRPRPRPTAAPPVIETNGAPRTPLPTPASRTSSKHRHRTRTLSTRYPGARLLKRLQASYVATWRSASCARRSAFGSTGFRERRLGPQLSADYASHRKQYKGKAINSAPRRQSFGARKQVAGTGRGGYCIAN
jgi:hypothetical protein